MFFHLFRVEPAALALALTQLDLRANFAISGCFVKRAI